MVVGVGDGTPGVSRTSVSRASYARHEATQQHFVLLGPHKSVGIVQGYAGVDKKGVRKDSDSFSERRECLGRREGLKLQQSSKAAQRTAQELLETETFRQAWKIWTWSCHHLPS